MLPIKPRVSRTFVKKHNGREALDLAIPENKIPALEIGSERAYHPIEKPTPNNVVLLLIT